MAAFFSVAYRPLASFPANPPAPRLTQDTCRALHTLLP
jgi:hypothetical protein